jgi:hypothetical protein
MTDYCDLLGGPRRSRDVLRDLGRVKDLRSLVDATRRKLHVLEKNPHSDPKQLAEERTFLELVQRELYKLEIRTVMAEFGVEV